MAHFVNKDTDIFARLVSAWAGEILLYPLPIGPVAKGDTFCSIRVGRINYAWIIGTHPIDILSGARPGSHVAVCVVREGGIDDTVEGAGNRRHRVRSRLSRSGVRIRANARLGPDVARSGDSIVIGQCGRSAGTRQCGTS